MGGLINGNCPPVTADQSYTVPPGQIRNPAELLPFYYLGALRIAPQKPGIRSTWFRPGPQAHSVQRQWRGFVTCLCLQQASGTLTYPLLSHPQMPFPEHLAFPTGCCGLMCRRAVLDRVDSDDMARLASPRGNWAARGRVNTILGSVQVDTKQTVLTFPVPKAQSTVIELLKLRH